MLRGLAYLHSAGVMHRDFRPENILVNTEVLDLKIADFGLATIAPGSLSPYVVARWYRAPEIIINMGSYDVSSDMWSFGCVLGEMLLRKPLFRAKDSRDLIMRIHAFLGSPTSKEELDWVQSSHVSSRGRS